MFALCAMEIGLRRMKYRGGSENVAIFYTVAAPKHFGVAKMSA
jgi:hypothetical protein